MYKRRNETFLYDDAGKLIGVMVQPARYRKFLSALEDLDEVRAYDEAKSSKDDELDLETVVAIIDSKRKK